MDCARTMLAAPTALRWPRARLYPESRGPWRRGLLFDASEQQIGQNHGINEPRAAWTVRAARSRAAERGIRAGHRITAAFVARISRCGQTEQRLQAHRARKASPLGAPKERAAIQATVDGGLLISRLRDLERRPEPDLVQGQVAAASVWGLRPSKAHILF